MAACTDLTTKPWVIDAGVKVLNQPFNALNNVATAGGCMASQYLTAWVIAKLAGHSAAEKAIYYGAPVSERGAAVEKCMAVVTPTLPRFS